MQVCSIRGADLARLGEFYAAAIQASAVDFDVVLALLTKAFQLALQFRWRYLIVMVLINPCFNRKEVKDHGEGGNLIGSHCKEKNLLWMT